MDRYVYQHVYVCVISRGTNSLVCRKAYAYAWVWMCRYNVYACRFIGSMCCTGITWHSLEFFMHSTLQWGTSKPEEMHQEHYVTTWPCDLNLVWPCDFTTWPCDFTTWPCDFTTWPCDFTTWPCDFTTWPCDFTTWPCDFTTWPCDLKLVWPVTLWSRFSSCSTKWNLSYWVALMHAQRHTVSDTQVYRALVLACI